MAIVTPPTITAAPAPAPLRGDRTTFSTRVDAFVTWLTVAVSQFYALGVNVANNATEAYNSAVSAMGFADTASNAATTATTKRNEAVAARDAAGDSADAAAAAAAMATGIVAFSDANPVVKGSVDPTKLLRFENDVNIPTGTTVILTVPGASGTIATTADVAATSIGDHEVSLHTGNGYPSNGTFVRIYTTVLRNIGTAITYAASSSLGPTLTINETGMYNISMTDVGSAACTLGATLNYGSLAITAVPLANRICFTGTTANVVGSTGGDVWLTAGSIVRPLTDGAANTTTNLATFKIKKVAK